MEQHLEERNEMVRRRDAAFLKACREAARGHVERGEDATVDEVVWEAIHSEAPYYFIAYHTVRNGLRAFGKLTPHERAAWMSHDNPRRRQVAEIVGRARRFVAEGRERNIAQGILRVLRECRAPGFFMTPGYARRLYFEAKRRRRRIGPLTP